MAKEINRVEEEACANRFYKIVLSWDYRSLREESREDGTGSDLKAVKTTYEDDDDYISTYEPLLFEEVKAQIIQGNDEDEGVLVGQPKLAIIKDISVSDDFCFPRVHYNPDKGESISQNDLVLVSGEKFAGLDWVQSLPRTHAFALVEHPQNDILSLRMFLLGEVQGICTDNTRRLEKMREVVRKRDKPLYISKVCSLSTIFREFIALRSIRSLPFKDLILKAGDSNSISNVHAWNVRTPLKAFIEDNHNSSQLDAIHAGLSRKPFVLIQGPPGTGKTQTILGLLSAILHATPATRLNRERLRGGPRLRIPMEDKHLHFALASPWLYGVNPRDVIMPVGGNDGYFPITGNEMKPEIVNSNRKYRVRVLVCAPSNSALDEIVLRVLQKGVHDENNRVYHPKIVRIGLKPHHSVRAVSIDYLVERQQDGMKQQNQGEFANDIDSIRAAILEESVIVFSTLSFSGSTIFTKLSRGFDIVIIDEAAQAVEPSTLVPLMNGCKQVFLVGDPKQLPATVISSKAESLGYGMSLFTRFQSAGYPVVMLKTQYRMHPEIREFPSTQFYDNKLEDAPDVEELTTRSWHEYQCFGPFSFFDVHEGEESQPEGRGSWVNVDEVEFVLFLYQKLVTGYPELRSSSRIAIISPYRLQVKLLRKRFHEELGFESDKLVDINTVDGFQGREKDVAIFSCVRASKDKGIGFVADCRRMNVGITRAKSSILVVGSASTLKKDKDKYWSNLVAHAEKKGRLFKVSKPYTTFLRDESFKPIKAKEAAVSMIDMDNVYGNPDQADMDTAQDEEYDLDGNIDDIVDGAD